MTRSRTVRKAGALAAFAACALALPLTLTAAPAGAAASQPEPPSEVLRSRNVPLDIATYRWLCRSDSFGTPQKHTFRLFHDVKVHAVADRVERDDAQSTVTWLGHVAHQPAQQVVVSTQGMCAEDADPAAVGLDAQFDLGERVYRISLLRNEPGRVLITEEDPDLREKPTGDDADPDFNSGSLDEIREAREKLMKRADSAEPVVIDMVVGYTPSAEWHMGGKQGILSRIQFAESAINRAFADSGVRASVDIVATYRAPYYGDETASTVHKRLSNPYDAQLGADAARLREQYAADLVGMIVKVPSGTSTGQGSLPMPPSEKSDSEAYNVTDVRSIVDWYNFGHEVGHNLGLWHDRTTLDEQTGGQDYRPWLTTPYSTGYVTLNRQHHTLMAYSSACGQPCSAVNQYSSPLNTWNGQALGDAHNDNAEVARKTTPIIAEYRTPAQPRTRYALTLTPSPSDGGSARPDTWGPYRPNTTVSVTATPAQGYRLIAWELNGQRHNITATQVSVTMDQPYTLKPIFTRG
ncbi:InlB B-repeat-containing protein [Streptomyces sp. PR69]|uniref:InlB B-repeat-containing protein n=1 Tax=Streptomyces sp. PR69 TaxID=2984950 RepID=UPI002263DF45|nr:M12 family metallo-peptidase [Streptomyces sp. PR69]